VRLIIILLTNIRLEILIIGITASSNLFGGLQSNSCHSLRCWSGLPLRGQKRWSGACLAGSCSDGMGLGLLQKFSKYGLQVTKQTS